MYTDTKVTFCTHLMMSLVLELINYIFVNFGRIITCNEGRTGGVSGTVHEPKK